jgi:hypothetical protein
MHLASRNRTGSGLQLLTETKQDTQKTVLIQTKALTKKIHLEYLYILTNRYLNDFVSTYKFSNQNEMHSCLLEVLD